MGVPGTQNYIPEELINRIRDKADIVEIIAEYLSLAKSGENYKGLCPFHSEKTPSFVVSPKKQIFHCFGCGTGGDLFHFIMKMDGLNFPEAVTSLGKRYGITFADDRRILKDGPLQKEKELLYLINSAALEYYQANLYDSKIGSEAMEYLIAKRGLDAESVKRFGLGFAPRVWDGLFSHMVKKGWTARNLEVSGLILKRNDKSGYYDRFRSRITFPIRDITGRVIGFGGRSLDESLPKYINSPETPIYVKGKNLYGLDKAKEEIKREDGVIIVEGYLDAIRLHQAGIRHVVATLGTALTPSHLEMIKRFTQKVYLVFDPDPAGIRAAIRTIGLFIDYDIRAQIVSLPTGDDPDSFINRCGKDQFFDALKGSSNIIEFALSSMMKDVYGSEIEKKKNLIDEILPVIGRIGNSVEKTYYINLIAERLKIEERFLVEDLKKISQGSKIKNQAGMINSSKVPKDEEILICLIINNKITPARVKEEIRADDFNNPNLKGAFKSILESIDLYHEVKLEYIIQHNAGNEEIISFLSKLSLSDPQIDYTNIEGNIKDCISRLRRRRLEKDIKDIDFKIKKAEEERDYASLRELQEVKIKKMKMEFSRL